MAKLIPWLFLLPPVLVAIAAIATVLHGRTPRGRALKHFRAAGDHVHLQEFDKAEASFREALTLWPDHAPSAGSLASLLIHQERFEEAAPLLDKAMGADPNDERLKLLKGRSLQGQGDQDAALGLWKGISPASDVYPDAQALVAGLHEARGELDEAIAALEAAIGKSTVHQARPYKKELKRLQGLKG